MKQAWIKSEAGFDEDTMAEQRSGARLLSLALLMTAFGCGMAIFELFRHLA